MTIPEIVEILQQSRSYELNPDARYLVVTESMPAVRSYELQEWLNSNGVNCIVLPVDCKLYEIKHRDLEMDADGK